MAESAIHAASWLINPDTPPIAGGAILVHNGLILASGTLDELRRSYNAPLREHPGCAIVPGFVNAHTHLELTHFPAWRERNGMGYDPRSFVEWIIQLIKVCRGLEDHDYRTSLSEGLRKCIESGTTAVGDIITRYDLAAVYASLPIGGRLYYELLGHERSRFDERLKHAVSAASASQNGLLRAGISPHATYTIGDENFEPARDAARSNNLPISIHVSESLAESEFLYETAGPLAEQFYPFVNWQQYLMPAQRCTAVELLDRHGLLTETTLAVHCVHVNLSDAQTIKQRGSSVCLCPRSNDRLDVGRAPAALFKKLGIPLALGTDSLASNDSLSLWDEMRYALDAFSDALSPGDLLQMASIGGATALGLSDRIGSLEPGKLADFQVIRNIGEGESGLLERLIGQGRVSDVYLRGLGSEDLTAG